MSNAPEDLSATAHSAAPTAAESLEGMTLPGGWRVLERLERPPGHTGGFFSVSYRVVSAGGGEPAFLKVLDYSKALSAAEDPAAVLQAMTAAYLFEVDVLRLAGERRLSRVVRALDSGQTFAEGPTGRERINYLIFEIADGDVRQALDAASRIDDAWRLRMLHHAATGVRQLHNNNVAYQDLKPSNVLIFPGGSSKVADLGCASRRGVASPRDGAQVAGDRTYAPPELLYGHVAVEWSARRVACDLYHLGSLAVFLFTGQNMTALLMNHLAFEHRPKQWGDSYGNVLPFVRVAYNAAMQQFATSCPDSVGVELVARVRELCDPDPQLRGHPLNRRGHSNPYSLERYVAAFDNLSRKAVISLRRLAP